MGLGSRGLRKKKGAGDLSLNPKRLSSGSGLGVWEFLFGVLGLG